MICHFRHNVYPNLVVVGQKEYPIGPWCMSYFGLDYPENCRLIKTTDVVFKPDEYCPKCIEVYNIMRKEIWNKTPQEKCSYELGRQCN